MATEDTMMNPRIESLMKRTASKFGLVTLSARRAREINSYFNQLGEGLGTMVPPQVSSTLMPALNVRSSMLPVRRLRNLVRTNAPPLPGFTC